MAAASIPDSKRLDANDKGSRDLPPLVDDSLLSDDFFDFLLTDKQVVPVDDFLLGDTFSTDYKARPTKLARRGSRTAKSPVALNKKNKVEGECSYPPDIVNATEEGSKSLFEDALLSVDVRTPRSNLNNFIKKEQFIQKSDILTNENSKKKNPAVKIAATSTSSQDEGRDHKLICINNSTLEERMEKFQKFMYKSADTHLKLQIFDKKNGLPRNHCKTMIRSSQTRKNLQNASFLLLSEMLHSAS